MAVSAHHAAGGEEQEGLLSVDTVGAYVTQRGLVPPATPIDAVALGGGVSNVVLAVRAGERQMVVKQSLPRLRVAEEWLAKRERVMTEAAALRWAATVTPGAVPTVLDVDPASYTIVIAEAPRGWRDWKALLLAGNADPLVAARLGTVLAAWHTAAGEAWAAAGRFDDAEAFEQLRVAPYYRAIMARHPALSVEVSGYVDRMLATRRCLVHGDFSPKNVLVGADGLWVLDFEVAHLGDPAFDLAFMLNHLLLKAIHRPACLDAYGRCAAAFWDAYQAATLPGFGGPTSYVLGHTACLMLARVDGKSPAEYLTPDERDTARALGHALLAHPPIRIGEVWDELRMAVAP